MPTTKVTSFVATSYVRDLERSQAFYAALGFDEQSAGSNALSAWSSLRHEQHSILLVTSRPPLDVPRLPLLFYFYVEDLSQATKSLEATGSQVDHAGYPPHALGGEAKTLDPDGNTVLLGQAVRSAAQPVIPEQETRAHFSLLREAAALARNRADREATCQVPNAGNVPCPRPAEVKVADTWGDTAWACIAHAEEVLINTSNAFIANEDEQGLGAFLTGRRRP
jgi:predicted enzyme related to lactoylglutathione lyase